MKVDNTNITILIGLIVVDFYISAEGASLSFNNGIKLFIYNYYYFGNNINYKDNLLNAKVVDVYEDDAVIKIFFNNDIVINIDMSESAYNGPEAIQLITSDNEIIIWN